MEYEMQKGCWVAAITPMLPDGSIDFNAWQILLKNFVNSEAAGIVVLGTTGESININKDEREQLLEIAAKTCTLKPWYAGVGHASMAIAIEQCKQAERYNASGLMAVTPFYNRPMTAGLIDYYKELLDFGMPVMAYNVPSRTGIDVGIEVWDHLYEYQNFVAIKEASPEITRALTLSTRYPRLTILSGNDNNIIPWISFGGHGVVSVVANAAPNEVGRICSHSLASEHSKALSCYTEIQELLSATEHAVNPIAIKCIMHKLGIISLGARLPLKITPEIYQLVTKDIKERSC